MNNSKFLQLTLQGKITGYNNPFPAAEPTDFVLPYAVRNDDKDNQVIDYAKTIARQWKQMFGDNYGNDYAFGLYRTYSEAMGDDCKLNKLAQDYIRQNFKDETCFRRYFMNHKNAPKSPFDGSF